MFGRKKVIKIKNMRDDEMKMLGKIMLTEFVGNLKKEEIEFLSKRNPKIGEFFSQRIHGAQIEFEKTRNDLIDNVFTKSESKNKLIKECLFSDDVLPKKPVGPAKEKGMPFLHEASSNKIETFITANNYDKNTIMLQLKDIHKSFRNEVNLYLRVCQKGFIDNLTDEEKSFVNVQNQEQFQQYLGWDMFSLGYEKCYDNSVVEVIDPKDQRDARTIVLNYEYRRVYDGMKYSNEAKYSILSELQKSGMIENKEQEDSYKRELDSYIITRDSKENIANDFLGRTSANRSR